MPSTFTANTGFEKIGDGEQTALWGQTTNLNFDIVDRALNGVVPIALGTTTYTLTTDAGTLSEGQASAVIFTGSPSGTVTVTVSPNTAQKTYIIRNTTTQSITITQGSGGDLTMPSGTTAIVVCTGVGAASQVFEVLGSTGGGVLSVTASAPLVSSGGSTPNITLTAPDGDLVGTTATQTLTNKTLTSATLTSATLASATLASPTLTSATVTAPTITGAILNDGYTEEIFVITDGTTVNLNPNNGSIQTWTLGANRTPGQASWANGQSILLMVDDGAARTISWASLGVVWKTDSGFPPALTTSGFTAIVLWKVDTVIYGARGGNA